MEFTSNNHAGHIEIVDYGQGKFVYHLIAKSVYRLFGNAESQNRHRKGDHEIRARLMALDYILENGGEHFVETIEEKLTSFYMFAVSPPVSSMPITGSCVLSCRISRSLLRTEHNRPRPSSASIHGSRIAFDKKIHAVLE